MDKKWRVQRFRKESNTIPSLSDETVSNEVVDFLNKHGLKPEEVKISSNIEIETTLNNKIEKTWVVYSVFYYSKTI